MHADSEYVEGGRGGVCGPPLSAVSTVWSHVPVILRFRLDSGAIANVMRQSFGALRSKEFTGFSRSRTRLYFRPPCPDLLKRRRSAVRFFDDRVFLGDG